VLFVLPFSWRSHSWLRSFNGKAEKAISWRPREPNLKARTLVWIHVAHPEVAARRKPTRNSPPGAHPSFLRVGLLTFSEGNQHQQKTWRLQRAETKYSLGV
jgi:hypothetical protein